MSDALGKPFLGTLKSDQCWSVMGMPVGSEPTLQTFIICALDQEVNHVVLALDLLLIFLKTQVCYVIWRSSFWLFSQLSEEGLRARPQGMLCPDGDEHPGAVAPPLQTGC